MCINSLVDEELKNIKCNDSKIIYNTLFHLRLWVGCGGSGSGGIVYVGGAIVGNRVVVVGDVAAVAAVVAVLWWGGLMRYVPS
jgi:hypothetical protein